MVSVLLGRGTARPVAMTRTHSTQAHTASAHATSNPSPTTLSDVKPGGAAVVAGLNGVGDPTTARRLFDLGFAPGARVEVLRRAPLSDPVVFAIAGYEIALRRAQADLVVVTVE